MNLGPPAVRLRLALVIQAIWMGALLAACILVPAVSFSALADPAMAGRVAGRSFFVAAVVGGISCVAVVALSGRELNRLWASVAITAAALPIASEWVVGPGMRAARAAGDAAGVRLYHSVGSVLFVAAAVIAIAVFWHLTQRFVSPRAE